jgi:hypothetical protein
MADLSRYTSEGVLKPELTDIVDPTGVLLDGDAATGERVFSQDEIEDADFRAVAVNPNNIMLPVGTSRAGVIGHLAKMTPSNEYGLPIYYVRSDHLDLAMASHLGRVSQDEVDNCIEVISYSDGYPTLASGSPFWVQLPHEPRTSYILFQNFLRLDEDEGIRLLDSLAQREGIELELVRETALEYYWSSRARAYDMFIVAAEAKKRETRTRKAENSHFDVAGQLLGKVVGRFTDEPELIDEMSAKDLFDLFEQLVKIQRLSLGLTGQNASTVSKEFVPGQSVEMVFRNLMKGAGVGEATGESIQNRLALLMSDEGTAMQAQEFIIRTTTGNVVNSTHT